MTREFKGTPGPWYYDSNGQSKAIFHPTDVGTRLALVDDTYTGTGWNVKANDEWISNARLIAAAPELLKELQEMIFWFDKEDVKNPSALRAIKDAKSVINKALGND